MTTPAAEKLYVAIFNPHNKPIEELPTIYGFNNGGCCGDFSGVLLSEDGLGLGGHICSREGYMLHDLGILEGTRPDRHETFRKYYPDGYKMDFVGYEQARTHEGLVKAVQRAKEKKNEQTETI